VTRSKFFHKGFVFINLTGEATATLTADREKRYKRIDFFFAQAQEWTSLIISQEFNWPGQHGATQKAIDMYRQLGEVTEDNKKASRIKTIIHPELHTEPPMLLLASTSCVIRDLSKSCFTNYAKPAVEHDPHSLQTV
jgi:hypothetical protein